MSTRVNDVADGSYGTSFQGKVVVITGAGGQFGRAGCIYFAKRGARIAALDNSETALEQTLKALDHEFGANKNFDYKSYVCDVTNASLIAEVVDSIEAHFKRIDYLWNNAGYQGKIQPLLDYDPQDFAMVMNINVTGMFIVLQAVARKMKNQPNPGGVVVNTASVAGLRGTPAMVAYASSKAAVLSMTVCASKDLAPHGIRVNAVSPALIGPGFMWDRQNELHAMSGSPYFDADPIIVAQNKIAGVPLKRLGSVEEVLNVVAFLLSDQSSYMTGTNLQVDGGMASGLKA